MVVLTGAREGFLEPLVRSRRVAVAETVREDVLRWVGSVGPRAARDVPRVLAEGGLPVYSATPVELAAVWGCTGCQGLARGELESVALVLGRGFSYCTDEPLVRTVLERLGVMVRWVPLEGLMNGLLRQLVAGGGLGRDVMRLKKR